MANATSGRVMSTSDYSVSPDFLRTMNGVNGGPFTVMAHMIPHSYQGEGVLKIRGQATVNGVGFQCYVALYDEIVPSLVRFTKTDANGNYSFVGLPSGTYLAVGLDLTDTWRAVCWSFVSPGTP